VNRIHWCGLGDPSIPSTLLFIHLNCKLITPNCLRFSKKREIRYPVLLFAFFVQNCALNEAGCQALLLTSASAVSTCGHKMKTEPFSDR